MRQTKLFYGSSYDRGLIHLLQMWPKILEAVPNATLEVCYGWDLFEKAYRNNEERMNWKVKMDNLMTQKGITHHGRVGQKELKKIRKQCGIWAYPTHFQETNCITALESQMEGLVPVTIALAGLKLTVGSGVAIKGDIYLQETKDEYLKELISMMTDTKRWEEESKKAIEFAKNFDFSVISSKWAEYL